MTPVYICDYCNTIMGVKEHSYRSYCSHKCFMADVDKALTADGIDPSSIEDLGRTFDSVLELKATDIKPKCQLKQKIKELHNDAVNRIKNIDSFKNDKLNKTRAHFLIRADVLSELLSFNECE